MHDRVGILQCGDGPWRREGSCFDFCVSAVRKLINESNFFLRVDELFFVLKAVPWRHFLDIQSLFAIRHEFSPWCRIKQFRVYAMPRACRRLCPGWSALRRYAGQARERGCGLLLAFRQAWARCREV